MLITLSESHCSAFAVTETPTIDRQLSGVELSGGTTAQHQSHLKSVDPRLSEQGWLSCNSDDISEP